MRDVIKTKFADSDGPQELNMLEYMSRTALELIGRAGLGYSFDALNMENQNNFATATKQFQYAALSPSPAETDLCPTYLDLLLCDLSLLGSICRFW